MHRPKSLTTILLLLSFTSILILIFISHFHLQWPSSSTLPSSSFKPSTPSPPFTFTIKLLTYNRLTSLNRCLHSLTTADYLTDTVHLHIYIDHFPVSEDKVDGHLQNAGQILDLVDGCKWVHGEKVVHYRTGNVGLQAQWVEAWWPGGDDEFVFVVEDDVEVAKGYYRFLKGVIMRYYYEEGNFSGSIYGVSLQRPRFVSGKHGNKLQVDSDTHLFLYQMVGTWGQLLFPKPWKEFRLWYDVHKAKGIKPILQGMVSTGWYKKMGERIWTPWFIKFLHYKGYYNIYTNFPNERALSTSHRDAGVNYGKSAGPDSSLLDESSLDFNLWEMPPLKSLNWYDFCFRQVFPGRILRSYKDLGSFLDSVQKQKTVVLISLYRVNERVTRNLLCHLEKLGLQNVIFVGGEIELLLDLARRGYTVIDSDMLVNSLSYQLRDLEPSDEELVKEIRVEGSVVKKCLEMGLDSWVLGGNIIPITASFSELTDTSYDFSAAKDVELMLVKASQTSSKIWDDKFISKMAAAAKSVMASNSLTIENTHFSYFATKILEGISAAKVLRFNEYFLGVKLGDSGANNTGLMSGKKMVFWPPAAVLHSIQTELDSLQMWLIDGDSSCVAVICKPQYLPT